MSEKGPEADARRQAGNTELHRDSRGVRRLDIQHRVSDRTDAHALEVGIYCEA